MGQAPQSWCRDGLVECKDFTVWPDRLRDRGEDGARSALLPAPEPPPPEAEWLLGGLPRELAEALRESGQWTALRRRPWLSAAALRGLQRSLQQCHPRQLAERFREAETPDECTYDLPIQVRWSDLDVDHVVCAGQVLSLPEVPREKLSQLKRQGFQALRQNKVGVALLAGGANLRLGSTEAPVGCMRKALRLRSGKSILQLCCERVRRMAELCRSGSEPPGKHRDKLRADVLPSKSSDKKARPSIPVFVMTSRLTHRAVVEHFESNNFFGLPIRDVFFFEQPVYPALDEAGQLLPQSLGGDFAHLPGGTGQALQALVGSLGLERMRDRGVECLHIMGTENVLAKVCDPVFIGFCRDLDIDCACKVVERMDLAEDLELFCVKQSPVSSAYADIEEAACGLDPGVASFEMLSRRSTTGDFAFHGSINSVYMTVSYIEEVVDRRLKAHMVARPVPFLDFHPEPVTPATSSCPPSPIPSEGAGAKSAAAAQGKGNSKPPGGVLPGSWPAEAVSQDLVCQRSLLAAAMEVQAQRRTCGARLLESADEVVDEDDPDGAWRCDVHLDCGGPVAVVRVRSARPGAAQLPRSLAGPRGSAEALAAAAAAQAAAAAEAKGLPQPPAAEWLRCSLVAPGRPNAWVLETSILDYFAFTDRAVALQVARSSEFAPVRAAQGLHTAEDARRALHSLHCSWMTRAGVTVADVSGAPDALLEVSPLLSYEGEGLEQHALPTGPLHVPVHVASTEEVQGMAEDAGCNVAEEAVEGLDTRPFYLQEYPLRPEVSCSHAPRFLGAAARKAGEEEQEPEAEHPSEQVAPPSPSRLPALVHPTLGC